jgi:hypothetical protein
MGRQAFFDTSGSVVENPLISTVDEGSVARDLFLAVL